MTRSLSPAQTMHDPGELVLAAEELVIAASDTSKLSIEQMREVVKGVEGAVAAIEKLLGLIPAGQDRVPAAAFQWSRGREVHAREPERFTKASLEATRDRYKKRMWALNRELGAKISPEHHARSAQLAKDLVDAMDAPEDAARKAELEAHDRRNEELLEVYYVRSGQRPPLARTLAEIELATELELCKTCKRRALTGIQIQGKNTAWIAEATCGSCGAHNTFAYNTKSDPATVTHATDELGPGPSLQIRAEKLADELARVLPQADRDAAAWKRALLCVNELIKLTRPGKDLDALTEQRAALLAKGN